MTTSPSYDPVRMEIRQRVPADQFLTMVDFMEKNRDLSKPSGGLIGRAKSEQKRDVLTNILNSKPGGVKKQSVKWKKVWADYKTKTKKKYSVIRHSSDHDIKMILTETELRVLSIMGYSGPDIQLEHSSILSLPEGEAEGPQDPSSTLNSFIVYQMVDQEPPPINHKPLIDYNIKTEILSDSNSEQVNYLPSSPERPPSPVKSAPQPRPTHRRLLRRRRKIPQERPQNDYSNIDYRRLELEAENRRQSAALESRRLDIECRKLDLESRRLDLDARRMEIDRANVVVLSKIAELLPEFTRK